MGPAVRRTRPQSRITGAPVHDPNYSGPKVGIAGAVRSSFALKARLLGTEFLDAETGRQKSSRKGAHDCRDKVREASGRKSPQKRPFWRRLGQGWFAETGWGRWYGSNWLPPTQSSRTASLTAPDSLGRAGMLTAITR